MPKLDIVLANDWIALYVDGVKKYDGHSLPYFAVLDALGIDFTVHEAPQVHHLAGEVDYADRLEDVKVIYYEKE